MRRLIALLLLLPSLASADWAPRPAMFSYAATFDACTSQPDRSDLAATCAAQLDAAYVLKRAVARATVACGDLPFSTCAAPFEDEGLPAIAAHIAHDIGCDTSDITTLPDTTPLPADHCVTITADIMIDEGVVPLNTEISCDLRDTECLDLANIHSALWDAAIQDRAGDDTDLAADLQARNRVDCAAGAEGLSPVTQDLARLACEARRAAALWADLAPQD